MALVAFASNRSPGLTTSVLALAARWPPPRRAVMAELDPDGGTVATRQVLAHDPGLISLAAAGNHGVDPDLVTANIQRLANGTPVLLAPPAPDRVTASLDALLSTGLPRALAELPGLDVLADCGRVDSRSAALPYLRAADAVVLVVRAVLEDIIGLQHRLQTLDLGPGPRGLVVVGARPYPAAEISETLGLPLLGVLADDARPAQALGEGRYPARSHLFQTAAAVAGEIVRSIPAPAPLDAGGATDRTRPSPVPPTAAARAGADR